MSRKLNLTLLTILVLTTVFLTSYKFGNNTPTGNDPNANSKKRETFQNVEAPPIPKKLEFAGEQVPLEQFNVKESLDREIIVNTFFHSQTLRFIKLAPRYFSIIEPLLKENNIPDDFKYLALAESGFDPKALSPAGAAGIWQFMKGTAKEYGLEVNSYCDERYNIELATHAACKYLHESYEKYGNWTTVAGSYNAGRNGIGRQIERQKQRHYYDLLLNEETARYVYRILALKVILENKEKYGYQLNDSDLYPIIPTKTITIDTAITNMASFAATFQTNYKMLKYFNPWLRDTYLQNNSRKTYEIKIPQTSNN